MTSTGSAPCRAEGCDAAAEPGAPVPLCAVHLVGAFARSSGVHRSPM
nr:hypothetical protein [Clavibacter michiganensis]